MEKSRQGCLHPGFTGRVLEREEFYMTDLQIKCFLEVAKYLNFTNAAKSLFISQSNISRQISALEEELELSLFVRNTKGVKLTLQGQMLAETLSEMSAEFENVLTRARNSVKKYSGSITLGCTNNIRSNTYLSQVLSSFRESRPEIKVVKERGTQKKLLEGLFNDYYDAILIAEHDVHGMNGVESLTLFYSRVGLVIHKSHPLFHKKNVSIEDFKDSPMIRYKPGDIPLQEDFLYCICRYYGFEPKVINEYQDFEEVLSAVEMGEGAVMIFEEEEAMANPNLRYIPIPDECEHQYLGMKLVSRSKQTNHALADFYLFAQRYANLHDKNK